MPLPIHELCEWLSQHWNRKSDNPCTRPKHHILQHFHVRRSNRAHQMHRDQTNTNALWPTQTNTKCFPDWSIWAGLLYIPYVAVTATYYSTRCNLWHQFAGKIVTSEFEVIKTGARDDGITLPFTFYMLGQCWDIFPPVIWCATKDSGDPRSHIDSHCDTDDQFDEPNFSEDSHWLIFLHMA